MELKRALERLGDHVAADQNHRLIVGRPDAGRVRERLLASEARLRAKRVQQPRLVRRALAVAAAVAATVLVLVWTREPKPLDFSVSAAGLRSAGDVGAWLNAARGEPVSLDFSDGSRITLEGKARARVTELSAAGAALVLESGQAALAIHSSPKRESRWRVNVGPFTVHVTGTRFDVDWDPEGELLLLTMHEGRVIVSGCMFDDGRPIVAGETLRAACREQRVEIRSRGSVEAPAPVVPPSAELPVAEPPPSDTTLLDEPSPEPEPLPSPAEAELAPKPRPRGSEWRPLLENGRYKEAYSAARATGFADECEKASAADLMALADAARFSGGLADAEHAYATLRRRFPSDERAAVAAFTLARIAFDQRHGYAEAAKWLRTYLRERPGGTLAREALGRLIEAAQRSGDRAAAEEAARQYMQRFPSGPHSELARRVLAH
jgi:TolA-binding protein